MDKSLIIGFVAGAVAVTAIGGFAEYKTMTGPDYAKVISAKEVTEQVRMPREICRDVVVTHRAPEKEEYWIASTAVNAVLDGAQRNPVGGGTGITLATMASSGHAGNKVPQILQAIDPQSETNTRCATVYDSRTQSLGYDVTYQLNDKQHVVRMSHNPGQRIPVRNGKLELKSAGAISPSPYLAVSKKS